MLTQVRLRELLDYDPETGLFKWKQARSRTPAGSLGGHRNAISGYVLLQIDRVLYRAHRLAWLYVHGVWPDLHIDHANGVKSDNRLCNLRQATREQNHANCKRPKHNSSGFKGVYWHAPTNKWRANIRANGKSYHLGLFGSKEEAHQKYLGASARLHGEFARAA